MLEYYSQLRSIKSFKVPHSKSVLSVIIFGMMLLLLRRLLIRQAVFFTVLVRSSLSVLPQASQMHYRISTAATAS